MNDDDHLRRGNTGGLYEHERERTMTALTLQLLMMRLLSCIFIHSCNGMSGIGYIVETSDCVNGCFLFLCFI